MPDLDLDVIEAAAERAICTTTGGTGDAMTIVALVAELRAARASRYQAPDADIDPALLVQQLRAQLADDAIDYIDMPDGHEDLPGVYASMANARRKLAEAEADVARRG